jgi:uncharacterized membrane protein (UPF0127 family)
MVESDQKMKKTQLIAFIVVPLLVIGLGYFISNYSASNGNLSFEASTDQFQNFTTVTVQDRSFNVELAVTDEEKATGLSGRESLASGQGMLFVFSPEEQPSFWMREMKFPLDIVWINDGVIVDITRNAEVPNNNTNPDDLPRYSPNGNVTHVLELTAGQATDFRIGDSVQILDASSV